MKIRQHAYFILSSAALSASELSRRVPVAPDRLEDAGHKSQRPLRPQESSWTLEAPGGGGPLDHQIADLLTRLAPARRAIQELTSASRATAVMQVVRYFDDEAGEDEVLPLRTDGLEKLPGQHQLLGWHLSNDCVTFLADVGATLDIDEYAAVDLSEIS